MICPQCRREIADYSNYCYFCGTQQNQAAAPPPRRLRRSSLDCKIAGVCGGLAEYLGTDATLVRLLWVLITFITGIVPGIVVYLVGWLIMPLAPFPAPAPQTPAREATAA